MKPNEGKSAVVTASMLPKPAELFGEGWKEWRALYVKLEKERYVKATLSIFVLLYTRHDGHKNFADGFWSTCAQNKRANVQKEILC